MSLAEIQIFAWCIWFIYYKYGQIWHFKVMYV